MDRIEPKVGKREEQSAQSRSTGNPKSVVKRPPAGLSQGKSAQRTGWFLPISRAPQEQKILGQAATVKQDRRVLDSSRTLRMEKTMTVEPVLEPRPFPHSWREGQGPRVLG